MLFFFYLTGISVLLDGWDLAFRKYVCCIGFGRFSVADLLYLSGISVLLDGWDLAYVFCNGLGRFSVVVLFT